MRSLSIRLGRQLRWPVYIMHIARIHAYIMMIHPPHTILTRFQTASLEENEDACVVVDVRDGKLAQRPRPKIALLHYLWAIEKPS